MFILISCPYANDYVKGENDADGDQHSEIILQLRPQVAVDGGEVDGIRRDEEVAAEGGQVVAGTPHHAGVGSRRNLKDIRDPLVLPETE